MATTEQVYLWDLVQLTKGTLVVNGIMDGKVLVSDLLTYELVQSKDNPEEYTFSVYLRGETYVRERLKISRDRTSWDLSSEEKSLIKLTDHDYELIIQMICELIDEEEN